MKREVARDEQTWGLGGDLFWFHPFFGGNGSVESSETFSAPACPFSHLKLHVAFNCSRHISIPNQLRLILLQSWKRRNLLLCYTCLITFIQQTDPWVLWLISNYSHVLLLRDQLWKNSYPLCSISFSCFLLLPYLLFPSGCCGARGRLLYFWIAFHVEEYSLRPLDLLLVTHFYCLYCPKAFVHR